ncbi:PilC/PilY family type IV pilus protein [Aliikangiella coralliicola]|uniref:Uncharacterized protein n=1 Tax=Aliikangiella coralliicola TaxID=2592383 RepID=A0A545UAA0_9GAMM|nr:PilC/PilY family type IV pilus protein [Aliikangiella coralliicola]TQV86396.1 hypothetical protein FLL46_15870 [Aliikangiella coralliicola]
MKKFSCLLRNITFGLVYSFCCFQAAADDTEVFFAPSSSTKDIKPNVMFIVDTSGSMQWDIQGNSNAAVEDRRITIVKAVMDDLLTDLTNVNAGLMRFTRGNSSDSRARGGPVLFPVSDIDLPATPIVEQEITIGANDGYEDSTSVVFLNSNQLVFDGASSKYTAVRFTDLNIPQGASIRRASVSFTASGDSAGAAQIKVVAQKTTSAPILTSASTNISSRMTGVTAESVTWTPGDWTNGNSYTTDDLAKVVQEVTDQPAWCGGNDLVLLFEGSGNAARVAYSAEGEAASGGADENSDTVTAARIRIEYNTTLPSGASGCYVGQASSQVSDGAHDTEELYGDGYGYVDITSGNRVAFGFTGINVPRNAVITDAYIELTAGQNDTSSASMVIKAIDDGTPALNTSMTSAAIGLTSASATWSGLPSWSQYGVHQTPQLKDIVQEVVNRSDWNSSGDMAFVMDGTTGLRRPYTYDGSPERAAKLFISYESQYTPGTVTLREDLKRAVQDLPATGNTPIAATIAEAGLYFKGEPVVFGKTRNDHKSNRVSHNLSYENGTLITPAGCTADNPNASDCADEEIIGNAKYISPIRESCQTNHIVYLTDGAPTSHHTETETIFSAWTGGSSCDRGDPKANCAVDIAGYLHNNDLSSLPGKQSINTHMIGFGAGADPELMRLMADAGGGGHYSAQSKDQLVGVLKTIVDSIASVSTTFVTTGVTVNQYNRLTHSDQLYFSLFSPNSKSVWPGNVKRYRLSNGEIVDANSNNAIDSLTSEFSKTSKSYWSDVVDGNNVEQGGVAEQLTNSRVIYSNLISTDLTSSGNRFNTTNITTAMLGAIDENDRKKIIHWSLGYDVDHASYDVDDPSNTPAHKNLGEPLHSQPVIVSYKGAGDKSMIYVGTNDGFLHAFDSDVNQGTESWAFIPKELLGKLSAIQKGIGSDHNYGMDGAISIYIDDANNNGFVDVGTEKAYLYVGMRRGGRSYYALDISDPSAPELKFIISGESSVGPGQTASSYARLAQTWSKPAIGKMDLTGVNSDKLVMIFGGGYDTRQDLAGTASATDTTGNIVYIADALDGRLLWSSDSAVDPGESEGPLSMNAVPSDITAFDLDGDDLIDHMYASDTKAQVFRFDVDKESKTIKGGRIASLQTAADVANNRRFYYPVDAALIKLIDNSFISVSLGSGYRAHPLDENITDHFYMIRDEGVLKGTFDMDVTMSDLVDVTNLIGDSNSDGESDAAEVINDENNPKNGWYIGFSGSGEKVIERSITFNNAVVFTTYLPPGSASSTCQAAAGGSRIYGLRIVDGNPYVDTNFDGNLTESDRYQDLVSVGIAPPPQVLLEGTSDGVKPRLCVGTQCNLDPFLPPTNQGIQGYRWSN